jgi:hypothetical protein
MKKLTKKLSQQFRSVSLVLAFAALPLSAVANEEKVLEETLAADESAEILNHEDWRGGDRGHGPGYGYGPGHGYDDRRGPRDDWRSDDDWRRGGPFPGGPWGPRDPRWEGRPRDRHPGRRGPRWVCYAQNRRGEWFRGIDFDRHWAERDAMEECYRYSRFCRFDGCRAEGGRW